MDISHSRSSSDDQRPYVLGGTISHTEHANPEAGLENVAATRTELLARRAQTQLAERGRDLLHDKREQLLDEFRATRRHEEGMSRAHDAAQRVESLADHRVIALRGKTAPHIARAVDAAVALVLEAEYG